MCEQKSAKVPKSTDPYTARGFSTKHSNHNKIGVLYNFSKLHGYVLAPNKYVIYALKYIS